MKQILFLVIFLEAVTTFSGIAQDKCIKCDVDRLSFISAHLDSISRVMITDFLCTFDKKCSDDAEFGEYFNELLFKVIDRAPKLFIEVLATKSSETKELILKEFSEPAVEMDFHKIFVRIKKDAPSSELKEKILLRLKSIDDLYKK
jgi:hypothetical protein